MKTYAKLFEILRWKWLNSKWKKQHMSREKAYNVEYQKKKKTFYFEKQTHFKFQFRQPLYLFQFKNFSPLSLQQKLLSTFNEHQTHLTCIQLFWIVKFSLFIPKKNIKS